jgi:hypothetical protein
MVHPLSIRYNLLAKEDPIDYTLNVAFSIDDPGSFIKLVNELFEACSVFFRSSPSRKMGCRVRILCPS